MTLDLRITHNVLGVATCMPEQCQETTDGGKARKITVKPTISWIFFGKFDQFTSAMRTPSEGIFKTPEPRLLCLKAVASEDVNGTAPQRSALLKDQLCAHKHSGSKAVEFDSPRAVDAALQLSAWRFLAKTMNMIRTCAAKAFLCRHPRLHQASDQQHQDLDQRPSFLTIFSLVGEGKGHWTNNRLHTDIHVLILSANCATCANSDLISHFVPYSFCTVYFLKF